VAQLAGVPSAVLREARVRLQMLEGMAFGGGGGAQAGLFEAGITLDSVNRQNNHGAEAAAQRVVDTLDDIDPDTLSPRAALDALYRLKSLRPKGPAS